MLVISFIQQIPMGYLLYTRHYDMHWVQRGEQNKIPVFMKLSLTGDIDIEQIQFLRK